LSKSVKVEGKTDQNSDVGWMQCYDLKVANKFIKNSQLFYKKMSSYFSKMGRSIWKRDVTEVLMKL